MSDDTPKPKPPVRPEPDCANSPEDGGGVGAWKIALVFFLIVGASILLAVMVGQ